MPDNSYKSISVLPSKIKLFLFFFLFFFLLAPYLSIPLIGNTGMFSLIILLILNHRDFFSVFKKKVFTNLCLSIFLLSNYAFLLSLFLNGDSPLYVFKLLISVAAYLSVGGVLYQIFFRVSRKEKSGEKFIIWFFKVVLLIVVLNSLIIIISQLNPTLKSTIESYLQAVSNIDYESHEWRARGLASAGGASLSIFHALGITIAFSMAINKRISYMIMILSVLLIFSSLIFIGRSGLIFAVIGVVVSIVVNVKKISIIKLITIPIIILIITFSLLYLLQNNVATSVLEYNLFNTFDYKELKNDEGLLYFFSKHFEVPSNPFILMFGVGSFESVNNMNVYSDSGYMRIFYYFGIPLALLFFIFILFILKTPTRYTTISPIYLPVLIVLLAANIKEPVLYTGYSARIVFVISGFLLAEKFFSKSIIRNTIAGKNR